MNADDLRTDVQLMNYLIPFSIKLLSVKGTPGFSHLKYVGNKFKLCNRKFNHNDIKEITFYEEIDNNVIVYFTFDRIVKL